MRGVNIIKVFESLVTRVKLIRIACVCVCVYRTDIVQLTIDLGGEDAQMTTTYYAYSRHCP